MATVIKTCIVCGKKFKFKESQSTIKKGGGKYCSRACKGIASRCEPRPCEQCGREFQPTYNTSKRFCSEACRRRNRKNGEWINCEWCGKEVYKRKCHIEQTDHRFCSTKCANAWQGRNKVKYVCTICGAVFRVSASIADNRGKEPKYCSIACRDADPAVRQKLIDMNARQQDMKEPTAIERIGYSILDHLGAGYVPQYLYHGKFCVDAYIPSCDLVIQFDGDYWHGKPDKYPDPDPRQQRRMKYDKSQDAYMRQCGTAVIRFWGSDLRKRPEHVAKLLRRLLAPA